MLTLRPKQVVGLQDIAAAFREHMSVLFVGPTGFGKTVVFSEIARRAAAKGNRVLILVHRRELLKQASRKLTENGVFHGVIAAGFQVTPALVQVASKDTLNRRLSALPGTELIIVDEAHHATATTYRAILEAYPSAHILGVTATPCRMTGAGLADVFDVLVMGPTTSELIEDGHLSPYRMFAPPIPVDLSGLHKLGGDYRRDEIAARMGKPQIVGSAIEHYRRYLDGEPTILFSPSVEHAETMAMEFLKAGYLAASVDGNLSQDERDLRIGGLADGSIQVLCSCDLISEGLDIPTVVGCINLRPTASLAVALQQWGRCLRTSPGKKEAIILDHVGNSLRHGLPDSPRDWTLEHGAGVKKRDENEPIVKQCPSCYYVHIAGTDCPSCGYAYPVKKKKLPKSVAGELAEVSAEVKAELLEKARTFYDLARLGKQLGRKRGWAFHEAKKRGLHVPGGRK